MNEYGEVELTDSEYDGSEMVGMMIGHTWKKIFLFRLLKQMEVYSDRGINL